MTPGRFARHRRANLALLLLLPPLYAAFRWLAIRLTAAAWFGRVEAGTAGLVAPGLFIGIAGVVLVVLLALGIGRLRPSDAGLEPSAVIAGLAMSAMVWGVSQVVTILPRVVAEQGLAPNPSLVRLPLHAGGLLAAALAIAASDGIVFRGILLPQLYLRLHAGRPQPTAGLGTALVISQALAVGLLVPVMLHGARWHGAPAIIEHIGLELGIALFLSWIYLRTGNLIFSIGVHALMTAPLLILTPPARLPGWFPAVAVALVAVIWTLLWPEK